MINFISLALACAPNADPETMAAIVSVESAYNPYAIGVVGAYLEKQPTNRDDAIYTAQYLMKENYNFSVGLAQINKNNFKKYNLSIEKAFDPCENLKVGGLILEECYSRAKNQNTNEQDALLKAFSCYYSGNFKRGFKPDGKDGSSYVQRVVNSSNQTNNVKIAISPSTQQNLPEERENINDVNPHNSASNGTLVF